jgi:hypothetical protein
MPQSDPLERLRELTGEDDPLALEPIGDEKLPPSVMQLLEPEPPLDEFQQALRYVHAFQPTEIDRSLVGEAAVGLVRGGISLQQMRPIVTEAILAQVEERIGESTFTRMNRRFAQQEIIAGEITKQTIFPRSTDRGINLRTTVGDVAEAFPQFAAATAAGVAAGPFGPLVRVAIFAGTAAMPAATSQYVEAFEATGDPTKAAIEAGAAGLIVFGLESIPGFALFRRGAAVGESLEELGEAVLVEAVASLVRDDPTLFAKMVEGDPEFWTETFRAMIAGFILGGGAGVTVGGIEVGVRLQELAEVAVVDDATIQEAHELMVLAGEIKAREDALIGPREAPPTPEPPPSPPTEVPEVAGEAAPEEALPAEEEAAEEPEAPEAAPEPTEEPPGPPMLTVPPRPAQADPAQTAKRKPLRQRVRDILNQVLEVVADVPTERTIAEQEILDEIGRMRVEATAAGRVSEGLREELLQLTRRSFKGAKVPKPLLTQIARVKTLSQFTKALNVLRQAVKTQRKASAIDRLAAAVGKIKPEQLKDDLREAFDALTDGIRFGVLSDKARERLEHLKALVEAGTDVRLSETVRNEIMELDKIPVQQLTVDEVTALADAVSTILDIQRDRRKAFRRLRRQEEQTVADTIAREIHNAIPGRGRLFRGRLLRHKAFNTTLGGLARSMFGVMENADLDFLGELLGGSEDSTSWVTFFQDVSDQQSDGLGFYFQENDALAEFLQGEGLGLGSEELADLSRDLAGTATTLGKTLGAVGVRNTLRVEPTIHDVPLASSKEVLHMTSAERIGLMLTLSDDETLDMVVFKGTPVRFRHEPGRVSRRLHMRDIRAITASMTEAEKRILRFMVERINTTMKDRMREHSLARRLFDITKPETWAPRFRRVETAPDPTTLDNLDSQIMTRIGLEPSIVKKRGEDAKSPIEVRDAFITYNNVAWATGMYTALEPVLDRVRRVLRNKNVKAELEQSRAPRAAQAITEILDAVAREITGQPSDRGLVEGDFRPGIRNIPVGILGLKPRIGLYQGVSIMLAGNEMPGGYVAKAMSAIGSREVDERMLKVSWLRHRLENSALGLINDAGEFARNVLGFGERGEGPMIFIRAVDRAAIRVIYRANEMMVDDWVAEGRISEDQRTEVLHRMVRRVVARTQPTFDTVHSSVRATEAKRKAALKLFNFFRAQRNKLMTMNMRSVMHMLRDPSRRVLREESMNLARSVLLNGIAIAVLRNVVRLEVAGIIFRAATGAMTRDDEDELKEWPKKFAADLIRTIGGVPFLGDWVAEGIVQLLIPGERAFEVEFSPLEGLVNDGLRGFGKAARNLNDGEVKDLVFGVLDFFAAWAALEGIPAPFFVDSIEALLEELESEDSGGSVGR